MDINLASFPGLSMEESAGGLHLIIPHVPDSCCMPTQFSNPESRLGILCRLPNFPLATLRLEWRCTLTLWHPSHNIKDVKWLTNTLLWCSNKHLIIVNWIKSSLNRSYCLLHELQFSSRIKAFNSKFLGITIRLKIRISVKIGPHLDKKISWIKIRFLNASYALKEIQVREYDIEICQIAGLSLESNK